MALSFSSCKENIQREYYPGGNILSEVEMKDEKMHGKGTTYYENGKIKVECEFRNDSLIGQIKEYYPNGKLFIVADAVTSEATAYSESGDSFERGKLRNTKKNGLWVEYVGNDKIKRFLWNYVDDVKNGEYTCFRPTGSIEVKGFYKGGTLDGPVYYFNEKGDTIKVQYWKANKDFSSSDMVKEEKWTK